MPYKKQLCKLLMCLFAFGGMGNLHAQMEEEGLEFLLFQEVPMVVSSSKKLEKISSAPSNITVISAARIRAMGLRTLRDVLAIIPGYFNNYDRDEWVPTARGVTSDNSLQYMLLVDGQDISIATSFGVSGAYEMPNDLSNVKQVEVIKGPGSVIWGGSSLGGVVNIVTKSAEDLRGKGQVNVSIGSDDTQKLDFIVGNTLSDDVSYVFSGTYYTSEGDEIETDASTNLPVFSQNYGTGRDPFGRFVTALDRFDPSYRLHFKGKVGDFDFAAYGFQNKFFNRQFEIDNGREAWLKRRVHFLEGKWKNEREDGGYIRTKLSMGKTEQEYFIEDVAPLIAGKSSPTFFTQSDDFLVGSVDGKNNFTDKFSLEWGVEVIRRDLFNSVISPASLNSDFSPVSGRLFGREEDVTSGLYAVILFNPFEQFTLLLGGRTEYNDTRGKDDLISTPRLGAIWETSETNTLKLLYNTGYRRPTPEREEFAAETIEQLELIWMKKMGLSTHFTVTAFWQELSDLLFLTQGGLTAGGVQRFVSGGSETASGVEIEVNTTLGESLTLWAALSLGNAEASDYPANTPYDVQRILPNGDKLGYLSESVAAGFTWNLTNSLFISPTVRYQGEMDVRLLPATNSLEDATYGTIESVVYVDCNIGYEPEGKNFAVYLYGNNLTDEREVMPHAIRNGTRETYGMYVEGKFTLFL